MFKYSKWNLENQLIEDSSSKNKKNSSSQIETMSKSKSPNHRIHAKVILEYGEGLSFAIKAEMKERPYIIVPLLFLNSILIASFILRAAEMPADDVNGRIFQWGYYWNSMWCTFVTMITIGYGDIYPITTLGKFVCIVICFWGNFLISTIIVSLTQFFNLTAGQSKVFY